MKFQAFGGNLGVHLQHYAKTDRYGYVGSLPGVLGGAEPATTSDVIAGRAWEGADGKLLTTRFPTFPSAADAVKHAQDRGVELCKSATCACRSIF